MRSRELETQTPTAGLIAVDGKVFPLESAKIHASARGGIAHTTLRQAFRNPYDEPLEVTYTLPLPADGAVVGFDIRVGDKLIVGEVESHDKALKKYREALESGRMAGILEQDRADTFTQNLGNVPPGTAVEVEIRVLHPVAFSRASGDNPAEWEYRFPTVVGVRYEGEPGRVPDHERLDVARADAGGTPVRLTLELEIGDGAGTAVTPRSRSHAIRVEGDPDAGMAIVRFAEPSRLDRDVTVRWRAATSEVGICLVEGAGLPGDHGRYGLLTIVPPNRPERTFARDLTLLIDASGSMSGPSIEAVRELSALLVGSLGLRDRFQILAFASEVERIVGEPTEATPENIARAHRALAGLQASGATEMSEAVEEALRPLRGDSQRQVVLLTDGFIGFEQEVVTRILDHLPPGARLHVVGIGSAPNRTLTRGASRAGRGVEVLVDQLVAGSGAIEEAAARLLAATVAPVLTDITIEGPGVIAVAPERPRDLLAGRPVVIALELSPNGGEVRVRGTVPGASEAWTRTMCIVASAGGSQPAPIGALFGREVIEDEEMKLAAAGAESRDILERIEALGLRHRITSRCTTLVAVAEEPAVDPRQPRRRQRMPVEMPAGLSPEAVGYAPMAAAGYAPMEAVRFCRTVVSPSFEHSEAAPGICHSPAGAPRESTRLDRRMSPAQPEIFARCVRTEGDLLVIEFESPTDNFTLPRTGSAMIVITAEGDEWEVLIDRGLSTGAGAHARGLTLRLALRRMDGLPWMPGRVRLRSTSGRKSEIIVDIR